ncbi:protein FAR1-RELATED SEQUENCE 5-like [Trifolium pratense]|nr:protein FAR1-RELATED SEQUENCE 5-like [Trifolium pratense]
MEGELSCENPEVTNLDLETDDVSDGSYMSSPEHDSNSNEYGSEHDAGSYTAEEDTVVIRDMADIKKISLENFHLTDISKYEFASLDVAYKFYCWFAKMSGFSVRKGHVIRNRERHVLQQTFLCSREGFRHSQGLNPEDRQRQQKNTTRCGCMAKCRVHIDIRSRKWYVTVFEFEHNHELLNGTMCGFLPAYRKMAQGDIDEIERNRTAGIRPYQVYGSMANASGGFHKVGFVKKDLYNQVGKQRKEVYSDTCRAVRYLRDLSTKDPLMFVTHSIDLERRLERLFWCDGESRKNYEIFGDVVAFDATYRKNKYNCPFVVFSGVNHHNQTIVFATGIVTRETEETYVWLLEQFLTAMNGKHPLSVITDGDLAMRNAIRRVFPTSHHRLCAWHLLRNASSNIGIPECMSHLKRCMLGDMEVEKFENLWSEMVEKFRLQDNNWVKDMYEKRKMWATAHIRGSFFAGIRTTSRCEALHSHIGQFLHSRINMTDFVQQFHRCLTFFRFREIEADFQSNYGEPVLQTSMRSIEKSAAKQFTKEIFLLFRSILKNAVLLRITGSVELSMGYIFNVSKYCGDGSEWYVTFCEEPIDFKCSCLRMESLGLPCDHILATMLYLDFDQLPECLVLPRWSKYAKDSIRDTYASGSLYWDAQPAARFSAIVQMCKVAAELVFNDLEEYNHIVDILGGEIRRLKLKRNDQSGDRSGELSPVLQTGIEEVDILNPDVVRTKGCGAMPNGTPSNHRSHRSCGVCRVVGHNKRSCPHVHTTPLGGDTQYSASESRHYYDDSYEFVGQSGYERQY